MACHWNKPKIAELLVTKGKVDVNQESNVHGQKLNPLASAIWKKHLDCVKILLRNDADPD